MDKYNGDFPHGDEIDHPLNLLCGGLNLATATGDVWRASRETFNPCFSDRRVLDMIGKTAREVKVFYEKLKEKATNGEVFELEQFTADLTLDVIASTILGTRLRHQTEEHPLAACIRVQSDYIPFSVLMGPIKSFLAQWSPTFHANTRRIRELVGAILDQRFHELQQQDLQELPPTTEYLGPEKPIISTLLETYLATTPDRQNKTQTQLSHEFKNHLVSQTMLFLSGGHETTSTTLVFTLHLLATHPTALSRLRAEHTSIFGAQTSPTHILAQLTRTPELLNRLPYTLAVIRETLRLYPPASGLRVGSPGITIADGTGRVFPTAGLRVWTCHMALQRNGREWKGPHAFAPERWLADAPGDMRPKKGAWRPFEWGPRNCIGQTLALMELRVVLLMVAHSFDIRLAYPSTAPTVWGSQAYLTEGKGLGAKPIKGYPCTVRFASPEGEGVVI